MDNAFLPNSNIKPIVNNIKNNNITNKPYKPFQLLLNAYGYINKISKSNSKKSKAKIKKEILN
jgi:hypothetical protein